MLGRASLAAIPDFLLSVIVVLLVLLFAESVESISDSENRMDGGLFSLFLLLFVTRCLFLFPISPAMVVTKDTNGSFGDGKKAVDELI